MDLRDYQLDATQMLRDAIKQGHKRIILGAMTSFGKTVVAAHLMIEARSKGKRGVFICDRVNLVEQTLAKFESLGIHCGVIQGNHIKTDQSAPVQIASIQTISRRKMMLEFDFAIVDECHTHYEQITKMMHSYNNVIFIGLSATPYSKGLGVHYSSLVVPITPRELEARGYLCPVKYFAGEQPDLSKIKLKNLGIGNKDFDLVQLSIEMEKPKLIGDAVKTWERLGENSQTIAFSPSIAHSRGLVKAFMDAGISAMHIDAYTNTEVRKEVYRAHDAGEFKILSCSSLLNTGYDSPTTRCIIDCYPTKSIIRYVQRVGRIKRIFPGKDYGIYLDHSGNVCRHGFAEDIVPESLHSGEKDYQEETQVNSKEKKEPIVCECCGAIMIAGKCGICGHEVKRKKQALITVPGELKEVKDIDQDFYSGLLFYAKKKGYADGWAKHKYKEKFGVFPTGAKESPYQCDRSEGYIKHLNIKRAKSNGKYFHKPIESIQCIIRDSI